MPTSKVADLVVDRSRRSIDFSEKLREICNFNLKQNTKYTTTPKTFDSVIIASLSCCLKYQEDKKHGPTFYKEAGQDELASKILYAYYNELEALNYESNKGVKLAKIIDKVTDNSYEEKYWEPLQIFSSRLATGFLPTRTFQLYEKRSENVNEIILRQRDVLEKMLSSLKGSVHDFFDSQFNNNIISHSLNAKIVSAYLVTTASSTPLMGALNEFFDEAISELSKKNKIYSEVIFETNTSERTGAGKATRIGVVPPHTTFEEHFLLIRNVIDLVIKKHKDSKGSDKNYAYNVIKINPSMSDFKHISEIVEKTNPINIIKELVVSRFDAIDNFGILATMKGTQEEKLALRDIIREFFTSAKATNIYSLVKEDLGGLSISNKIRDLLENGKLQELLLISYSKKSLWEFCSVIYELTQKLNEKETKKQLSMKIAEIFKNQGIKYEANDLENLAVLIYTKMYNIGNVLSI